MLLSIVTSHLPCYIHKKPEISFPFCLCCNITFRMNRLSALIDIPFPLNVIMKKVFYAGRPRLMTAIGTIIIVAKQYSHKV